MEARIVEKTKDVISGSCNEIIDPHDISPVVNEALT